MWMGLQPPQIVAVELAAMTVTLRQVEAALSEAVERS
jgi:hypothetical protein